MKLTPVEPTEPAKVSKVEAPKAADPVKRKRKRAELIFQKEEGKTLIKLPGDLEGSMFKINDLKNCTVLVMDHTSQMTIDRCEGCTFILGPIKAALFARDSKNCEFTVSCGQFRCRDLYNSNVSLYCPSDPIVESSNGLTFMPYNLKWAQLEQYSEAADLTGQFTDDTGVTFEKLNHWREIFDFTPVEGKKNFKLVEPTHFIVKAFSKLADELRLDAATREKVKDGDWIYDLPVEYGGTMTQDDINRQKGKDGNVGKAFDIKAGREAAAKQF